MTMKNNLTELIFHNIAGKTPLDRESLRSIKDLEVNSLDITELSFVSLSDDDYLHNERTNLYEHSTFIFYNMNIRTKLDTNSLLYKSKKNTKGYHL